MYGILQKRRTKRINRLFYKCAVTAGRHDNAWEHYRDKIVHNLELRMGRKYESLHTLLGDCSFDLVYRKVGRAVVVSRLLMVAAVGNIVVSHWVNYGNQIVLSVAGILLARAGGGIIVGRRRAYISRYLLSADSDLLIFFEEQEIKKTVRKHKKRLPGKAVGPHSFRHIVLGVFKEKDKEVLEIVDVLSEDWDGSASELLAAARKLL